MKILIISHNYFPAIGGAEKKIKEISERLVKSGEKVTVFCSNADTTEAYLNPKIPVLLPNSKLINGVRVRRFSIYRGARPLLNKAHDLFFWEHRLPFNDIIRAIWNGPIIFNMLPHILTEKTDIIVAIPFPFLNMYYAYIAKKIRGMPMAIIPCLHTEDAWAFDRKIMYKIMSDTEMIMTNTDYERDYLITNGIEKERIFILGDGVNPQDFDRSNPEKFRRRYDIGNAPVVLFVGRKEEGKGIDTLVDSMSIVWRKFPQAKLIVAGTRTSYSKAIEKKVSSLDAGKRRNTILIDNFEDSEKSDLFASCDIFAMPSKIESFGITYLEAWASGKPVIGCRIGAVASLIEEGKDGLLVEYGNEQELASAILKLLTDEDLKRKLGENGRKKACRKYTWDIVTERFRKNLNLAIWRHNKRRELLRKSLVIPEVFSTAKIIIAELKDMMKKILRKVPILFYIAYYVYRKVKKFNHWITDKWILYKMHIIIKNNPMKLKEKASEKNYSLCVLSLRESLSRVKNTPLEIQLEITNRCNLKCIMCARTFDSRYRSKADFLGDMDLDLVKKVRKILRSASIVYTFGNGEPLLNPNFLNILEMISQFGPRISFNTNGTLLNEKSLRKIVDLKIDALVFSIDSPIKESFEKIRKGSNFDFVIHNIELLNRLKLNKGSIVPHLGFAIVGMKENIREVPLLIKLARKLAVESVYIEPLIWQNDPQYEKFYQENDILTNMGFLEARKIFSRIREVAKEEAIKVTSPYFDKLLDGEGSQISLKEKKDNRRPICTKPWTTIFIWWNGEVRTCCGSDFVFGNLRTQTIEEIWNGTRFQSYRKQFITGEIPLSCENCLRNEKQENILQGLHQDVS